MLEITAIKTKDGYFLSEIPNSNEYKSTQLDSYKINGEFPEKTFHKAWVFIKSRPKTVKILVFHPNINYRYELKDISMESEKIPSVLIRDKIAEYIDYEWVWSEKYSHLQSLYELKSDAVEPTEEEKQFSLNVIAELDEIKEPIEIGKIQKTKWMHEGVRILKSDESIQQLIDKIRFPDILYPSLPCELSSDQIYKLVREFIKDNINPKYAEITSDYDFCFTVKKKIPLSEPEKYTVDVNYNIFSKRKKKPKYETRFRTDRSAEIFEMTPASSKYNNYTVISGLRANDHEELKEKLDLYLNDLIDYINSPVEDCPHCNGRGVIFK